MLDTTDRAKIYEARHTLKREALSLKELIKDCQDMDMDSSNDQVLLYYTRTIKRIDDAIAAMDALVELWLADLGGEQ